MKKLKITLVSILILGGIVAILMHNKAKSASLVKTDILKEVPVSVATVTKQKLQDNLSLVGTVYANNDVNVVSETQGRVTAIRAEVGDFVRAGAVLVQVDDTVKQANSQAMEVNYLKAKKDFERYESLYKKNTITASQLEEARWNFRNAESQYLLARKQYTDTRITTPISGYVTARRVDLGAMVTPGTSVADVVDISTLKVKLNVAEKDAFRLKTGSKVAVTTEVYPGAVFEGRIKSIAEKADEAHTYPVEIALANSKEHPLKAGMFARVSFNATSTNEELTIPRDALVGSIKEPQVYVVENNIAKLRTIVVGSVSGEVIGASQGLHEGDPVVVNGQSNLKDGSSVMVIR